MSEANMADEKWISVDRDTDIERWIRELKDAGWMKVNAVAWQSPDGVLYRGPFRAWQIMTQARRQSNG